MSGDFGRMRGGSIGGGPFGHHGVIGDGRGGSGKTSVDVKDMTMGGVPIPGNMKTNEGVQSPPEKNASDTKKRTVSNGGMKLSNSALGWTGSPAPATRPTSPTFHHGEHNRNASVETVESQPEHRDFYPWTRTTSPRDILASSQQAASHSRTVSAGSTGSRHRSISSIDRLKARNVSGLSKQAIVEDDEEDTHARILDGHHDRLAQQDQVNQQQSRSIDRPWVQTEATEFRIDNAQERNTNRFQDIDNRLSQDAIQEETINRNILNLQIDADHRQASHDFQLDDVRTRLLEHDGNIGGLEHELRAPRGRLNAQLQAYASEHNEQIAALAEHFHLRIGHNNRMLGNAISQQAHTQHHFQQQLQQAQADLQAQSDMMQQVRGHLTRLGLATTPVTPTQAGTNINNNGAFTHPVHAAPFVPQQGFSQQPLTTPIAGHAPFVPQQGFPQQRITTPIAGPSNPTATERKSDPRPNIGQPNPNDDVFGPRPSFSNRRPGPSPIAEFEQKPYHELLHSVFVGIEIAVRGIKTNRLDPRSLDQGIQQLIKLMAEHNNNIQQTKNVILRDPKLTIQMLVGFVGKHLVTETIDHTILDHFPSLTFTAEYFEACNEEVRARSDMMTANDAAARANLAQNRARLARSIAQLPGFQQWIKETAGVITNDLVNLLLPAIRDYQTEHAFKLLYKPVLEGLKIGVRMRQDAKNFQCIWYASGVRWDYKRMVQRNDELAGQDLTQDSPNHCVLFTMAPSIDEKVSNGQVITTTNLHKAEVVLGPRKELLR